MGWVKEFYISQSVNLYVADADCFAIATSCKEGTMKRSPLLKEIIFILFYVRE